MKILNKLKNMFPITRLRYIDDLKKINLIVEGLVTSIEQQSQITMNLLQEINRIKKYLEQNECDTSSDNEESDNFYA